PGADRLRRADPAAPLDPGGEHPAHRLQPGAAVAAAGAAGDPAVGPGHAGPRGDRHRPGHPARPGAERDHAAAGLAAVAAHADDVCPAAVGAAVGAAEPGAGPGRDPAPPRPAVPEAVPATADP